MIEAIATVAFGVLAGALSGLFGVGGGLVMVPYMVLVLHHDQHLAEGTSLLVIIPTALAGVIAHRRRGYVSFPHAAAVAAGGVAGVVVGARVALSVSVETLQTVFAVVLVAMAIRFIASGIRERREPRRPTSSTG